MIKTLKCTDLKGESHNFFYQSNLIFRIVMWCGIVSFGQRSLKHPKLEILVPDFVPRYLEWSKWLNNIICKYSKPFLQTGDVSETFNILMTKSDSGPFPDPTSNSSRSKVPFSAFSWHWFADLTKCQPSQLSSGYWMVNSKHNYWYKRRHIFFNGVLLIKDILNCLFLAHQKLQGYSRRASAIKVDNFFQGKKMDCQPLVMLGI